MLDEVQKLTGWSETVKWLWDEDTASSRSLRVILLGSSALLLQRELSESLAGRFELARAWHWSFSEMRAAFGWDVDLYVYFGGYPGSTALVDDEERWAAYIRDSLIETTISRNMLLLTRVDKPALLRQLFRLSCDYSAQKFFRSRVRQRGSIPKLLALNTALMSTIVGLTYPQARADRDIWGRLVETAVGAHLMSSAGRASASSTGGTGTARSTTSCVPAARRLRSK